jgi:hypothetical protein
VTIKGESFMGNPVGVFSDEEVKNLSDKQKLELRVHVINALKGPSGLGDLREKLRKDLAPQFGITLES